MRRKKPISISVLEDPTGRRIVKRFADGAVVEEPIGKTPPKQKARFPYPKVSLDKSRKKSF